MDSDYVDLFAVTAGIGADKRAQAFEPAQESLGAAALIGEKIGMGVTESLAMTPAASVSGFYLGHPESTYFSVGKIADDQLKDLAARHHMYEQALQRLLAPNL